MLPPVAYQEKDNQVCKHCEKPPPMLAIVVKTFSRKPAARNVSRGSTVTMCALPICVSGGCCGRAIDGCPIPMWPSRGARIQFAC